MVSRDVKELLFGVWAASAALGILTPIGWLATRWLGGRFLEMPWWALWFVGGYAVAAGAFVGTVIYRVVRALGGFIMDLIEPPKDKSNTVLIGRGPRPN